jgi:hypothetical protein
VPRKHITHILATHQPTNIHIPPAREPDTPIGWEGIHLPDIALADFTDFLTWTRTGRILPHTPSAVDHEWYIEHCARRLVSALALTHQHLRSVEYEQAAMTELHALGPLLEWLEELVNSVFAATTAPPGPGDQTALPPVLLQHAARRLLVAMVAAKTSGFGKRKVRVGPRDKNLERDERIRSGTFWKMFDGYCLERGGECAYPEGVDLLS